MHLLKNLKWEVFLPPVLFLVPIIGFSIGTPLVFARTMKAIASWILNHFDWLFSWTTFLFFVILIFTYFSKIGSLRIGGKNAQPLLSRPKWFAITLCTTIATGILFWGTAEPLYHLYQVPKALGILPSSMAAENFSMATLFLHWTVIPYSIYTLAAVAFAFGFYNQQRSFSLAAMLFQSESHRTYKYLLTVLDAVCLFALIAGMSASLGAGILALKGGLENLFNRTFGNEANLFIGITIALSFIISSISGLTKGIKWLSNLNFYLFILIACFILVFNNQSELLNLALGGVKEFGSTFLNRTTTLNVIEPEWNHSWTSFYWANWMAWAPITALFLGRLGKGYTIREFIRFNLVYPSLFSALWMVIFGGTAILTDRNADGLLYKTMIEHGEESVVYQMIEAFPFSFWISMLFVFIIFISYVTAADSNTSAMSALASKNISIEKQEAPSGTKILFGLLITAVAYVMLATSGIEGIKITSVLGGFPAMFILIAVAYQWVKLLIKK